MNVHALPCVPSRQLKKLVKRGLRVRKRNPVQWAWAKASFALIMSKKFTSAQTSHTAALHSRLVQFQLPIIKQWKQLFNPARDNGGLFWSKTPPVVPLKFLPITTGPTSPKVCLFILFWSLFHRESGTDCCLVCRGPYNIPFSLQTPRCSPIGTWNGQLKARNCLFHQLPLLHDQLGERSRLEIQKVTSQRVNLNAYEVDHFPQQGFFSLLLSPLFKSNLSTVTMCVWPQTTKFTHEITFQPLSYIYMYINIPHKGTLVMPEKRNGDFSYICYHSKNLHNGYSLHMECNYHQADLLLTRLEMF